MWEYVIYAGIVVVIVVVTVVITVVVMCKNFFNFF